MDRKIDESLKLWARKERRKPLLLRGARQTGKTFAVRKLGATFTSFVEINFEREPRYSSLFDGDLDIDLLIREISALRQTEIVAGQTLLFLDEIQACPKAVTALRYFFENKPQLHVVGAGSLLEFELKNLSMPVGRVEFMFVRPFTFMEYLRATKRGMLADEIAAAGSNKPLPPLLHDDAITALREYLYIGGMPGVVSAFVEGNSYSAAEEEQRSILQTYRADLAKYTGRTGIEYVEKSFAAIASMVGDKTVFSRIDPDARAYQIKGALDLLAMARVVNKVRNASGAAVPLLAGASEKYYKTVFLDIGLMQRQLGVSFEQWRQSSALFDGHRGAVAEQFVGQELLHRQGDHEDPGLFYWHRIARSAQAEVDYVCELSASALPVEVKSSATGHLKSLHQFLKTYPTVKCGVKCSLEPFSKTGNIVSVPLYAAEFIGTSAREAL